MEGNSTLTRILSSVETNGYKIMVSIVILIAGVLFALFIRALMRRSLGQRLPPHVYKPFEAIVYYSLVITAVIGALYPFGISLTSLIIAGGFAGIVVGLATQSTLSNLVSGLMLLIEQPLRIGDPVTVKNYSGIVAGMNVFSTLIRTWEGPIVRIPNNDVFNTVIVNYSRMKARRVEFTIGVHYDTDIEYASKVIKELMAEHPLCLVNPAPEVFVEDYSDSAVKLRMRCWAPTQAWFATKVDIQTKLKKHLDEANIVIPYPQLDLHVRDRVRVSLERND
ncbi:MAG: mechanosensitive ion channel family protein [Desulfurococcales archaeon]|nr:mechanosensitive ion channel family protein [Desulfurococcales archaeon]